MEKPKKYIHQDLLMAVILLLIGMFFFIGSFWLPRSNNPVSNIHTFPQLASGALMVFSAYNCWLGLKKSRKLNADLAAGKAETPELSMKKLKFPLIGIGMILLYAVGVAVIGFFVSTALFMVGSIYYLGYRKIWVILLVTAGLALLLISPLLARVALFFDSSEYFLLGVFGLSLVASLSEHGLAKGFGIGCLGLLVGCVGLAPLSSYARYHFGTELLYDGFNTTTVIIGCFSIAQVMVMIYEAKAAGPRRKAESLKLSGHKFLSWKEIKQILPVCISSSLIGVGVGILPGAGAATGSYIAYSSAKSASKHPEEFGKGCIEGVAAPEAANNAVTGSAMIPLLTLSIPGSTAASVLLGALMIQGLQPGFSLFTKQADIVFPIILGFLVANLLMLPIGILFARVAGNIIKIPNAILAPVIAVLAVLGSYCIRTRVFDIFVVVAFGLLGYFMKKASYAPGAFTLGLILGQMCESGLRRSFALATHFDGSIIKYYFSRPQCIVLMLLILFNMTAPVRKAWKAKRTQESAH